MDDEHFGNCLRRAREDRALTIGDISASTKVPRSAIEQLEAGALSSLPAHVFVRGFIRSYAKAVGINEAQAARPVRSRRQREDGGGARRSGEPGDRSEPRRRNSRRGRDRPSPRTRPRGVRDRPRADRDDHVLAAAAPSAAVGRGAQHGAAERRRRRWSPRTAHDARARAQPRRSRVVALARRVQSGYNADACRRSSRPRSCCAP